MNKCIYYLLFSCLWTYQLRLLTKINLSIFRRGSCNLDNTNIHTRRKIGTVDPIFIVETLPLQLKYYLVIGNSRTNYVFSNHVYMLLITYRPLIMIVFATFIFEYVLVSILFIDIAIVIKNKFDFDYFSKIILYCTNVQI